ncbi:MAG: HRDC domain-containing protein [Methylococcaceae bacterium]
MKFQFFTISALSPEYGQQQLNAFCGQHRVVSVEKQLIAQGENSYWSVCVSYIEGETEFATKSSKNNNKRGRIDYKEVLSEQDFSVYAELRNLRKKLAEQEGIPVYAIFSNEQLAEMVIQQVATISALANPTS